jgi:hypothetical protein
MTALSRHCEERSDEAIQSLLRGSGLLRCARNDGVLKGTIARRPQWRYHVTLLR